MTVAITIRASTSAVTFAAGPTAPGADSLMSLVGSSYRTFSSNAGAVQLEGVSRPNMELEPPHDLMSCECKRLSAAYAILVSNVLRSAADWPCALLHRADYILHAQQVGV
jgi:hypothetical protein